MTWLRVTVCPFCDKTFTTGMAGDARLVKHVNEHSLDPTNVRFKTWLEAANRVSCLSNLLLAQVVS